MAGFFSKRSSSTPTRGEFRAYVSCHGDLGPLCAPPRELAAEFRVRFRVAIWTTVIPRDSKSSRLHANSIRVCVYIYGKLSHP